MCEDFSIFGKLVTIDKQMDFLYIVLLEIHTQLSVGDRSVYGGALAFFFLWLSFGRQSETETARESQFASRVWSSPHELLDVLEMIAKCKMLKSASMPKCERLRQL